MLAAVFAALSAAGQPSVPNGTQPVGETENTQYVGPFRWRYSAVVRRGKAVRLAYESSNYRLERAVVATSRRSVRITLYGRTPPPPPPGVVTPAVLAIGCVEIPLRERVNRRKIVDGLTGRAPRGYRGEDDRYFKRKLRKSRRCIRVAVKYKR